MNLSKQLLLIKSIAMKSFFKYNSDLLKHLCVVAKIEKLGFIKLNLPKTEEFRK